jgi:NAD(P)-dependent dehydrogenase (short-subunit alcohol dehydrogenase family)
MGESSSVPVAIVTGGGRGIGAMVATTLAGRGHRVVITGRDEDRLAATAESIDAEWIVSDVTAPGTAATIVDDVVARHGRLDVLVNNAGTAGGGGPLLSNTVEQWWHVQLVNVYGAMAYMHAALHHMMRSRSGTILNIGSYAGIRPLPFNSAYGTSKAALARLTDSVAQEVAADGVTIMCLSPGLVATDMTRDVPIFEGLPPEAWEPIERIGVLVDSLLDRPDLHELTGRLIHVRDDIEALFGSTDRIRSEELYQLRMDNLSGSVD